ncbi:MAG: sortase, marine proteobacterial type [Gammaproteobacteria bacterium]|jgi:sortase A|nr:sortase, marine proteobacterial type [Gammaproteobacteria bacterium]
MSTGASRRVDSMLKATAVAVFAAGVTCLTAGAWIPIKAWAAQLLIDAAWRREHTLSQVAVPWPWADTRPVAKLTVGEGRAATTLIVLEGSSGRNLAFGPVHDAASVAPGALGNSVIEGHRDTHFKMLRTAKPGDRVTVEALDGSRSVFVVTDVRIVDSRRTRIALDANAALLTLVTCYPFDAINPGGPLRWLVTAERLSSKPAVASMAASRDT